jgi:hypothetical protein
VGGFIMLSGCLLWFVFGYYITTYYEKQSEKSTIRFKEILALRAKILAARSRVSMMWKLYDICFILSKHDPSSEEMVAIKGRVCLETFIQNKDILRMYYLIMENECPCEDNIREIKNLKESYERTIIEK